MFGSVDLGMFDSGGLGVFVFCSMYLYRGCFVFCCVILKFVLCAMRFLILGLRFVVHHFGVCDAWV